MIYDKLETWLGTWADSIPSQAYHELCAIQKSISVSGDRLPELPATTYCMKDEETDAYTADQLRAYGQQCAASRPAEVAELREVLRRVRAMIIHSDAEHLTMDAEGKIGLGEFINNALTRPAEVGGDGELRALEIDSYADSDSDRLTASLMNGAAKRIRTLASDGLEGNGHG